MSMLSRKKEQATDVVVHQVTPVVNTDHGAYSRLGWLIVLAGVLGFLLWAFLAPLDKGVPVTGTVTVSTARKAVQHLQGGTIQDILVKDGDVVKQGQVLVRMNDVATKAQADMTRVQYYVARAAEARLEAERDGRSKLTFPAELEKMKADPRVDAALQSQRQLFTTRQLALQNELAAMQQSVDGLKRQMQALEQSRVSKLEQQRLLKEQVLSTRELAADGFVARNRLLELERNLEQVNGAIAEDAGNLGRTLAQIGEISLRITQRQQEYQKEVRSQLTDVQREAETQQARLISQDFDLAATEIKAPVAGTVMGLSVFTKGGVVAPGYKMMDIVPANDALVVEGQVPVHLIDKVHAGLDVEMMFSAFNQNQTPHIPGKVTQISVDRLVDEHNGQPYYKLKAEVTPAGMKKLGDLKVQPGMPVEVFIKTGERTMMSYLLKPVIDRARTSMTEE